VRGLTVVVVAGFPEAKAPQSEILYRHRDVPGCDTRRCRTSGGWHTVIEPAGGDETNAQVAEVAQTEAHDKSFLVGALGNLTSPAGQAAAMDGSAGNLLSAAGGSFKLDPQVAAALAASCQEAIDEIRGMDRDLANVQQAPKLGTLSAAKEVATYTQNVATDPQGIVQAMASLNATLQQMHDAYVKASTNYQETNDQIAETMSKLDKGQPSTPTTTPAPSTSSPANIAANQNFNA
jgi:hypothetical protein